MTKIMEKLIKHDKGVKTVISLEKFKDEYTIDIEQNICGDNIGCLLSEREMILTRDFLIDVIDYINEEKEKGFKKLKYNDKTISLGYISGIFVAMFSLMITKIVNINNEINITELLTVTIFSFIMMIVLGCLFIKQEKEILNSKY